MSVESADKNFEPKRDETKPTVHPLASESHFFDAAYSWVCVFTVTTATQSRTAPHSLALRHTRGHSDQHSDNGTTTATSE